MLQTPPAHSPRQPQLSSKVWLAASQPVSSPTELSCAHPNGKSTSVAPSVATRHLARQSSIIAGKAQSYRRGTLALASPWYHTAPETVVRVSPTTMAFHSTESTVLLGMSHGSGPTQASSASGLDQCSIGVPPTSDSIRPTGVLPPSAENTSRP